MNRVTIRDNQRAKRFTVTMEKLRVDDTDMYLCGISRIRVYRVPVTVIDPGRWPCMFHVSQPRLGLLVGPDMGFICHSEGTILGLSVGLLAQVSIRVEGGFC